MLLAGMWPWLTSHPVFSVRKEMCFHKAHTRHIQAEKPSLVFQGKCFQSQAGCIPPAAFMPPGCVEGTSILCVRPLHTTFSSDSHRALEGAKGGVADHMFYLTDEGKSWKRLSDFCTHIHSVVNLRLTRRYPSSTTSSLSLPKLQLGQLVQVPSCLWDFLNISPLWTALLFFNFSSRSFQMELKTPLRSLSQFLLASILSEPERHYLVLNYVLSYCLLIVWYVAFFLSPASL